MANNFDGPVIVDTLDTTTLANYFAFGRTDGTEISTGPRIGCCNANPSAGAGYAAILGSVLIRYDAGNVQMWQKTTAPDTGWTQSGSLSGSVSLTAIDTTATAAFQWTAADAAAAAVSFGAGGALNMLVLDTTNGTEQVIVNAANGLMLANNSELRFGTASDMLFTPNGTNVVVSGAGSLIFNDNVVVRLGTTAALSGRIQFVSASNRLDLVTTNQTTTTVVSSALLLGTGTTVEAAAAVGGVSGAMTLVSGATDTTNAGGTGGASGAWTGGSGNATSTLGTSGATGVVTLASGNSDDAASGDVVLQTGTAGTTRGVLDINVATITLATQATAMLIIDNSATSLQILQGTNLYVGVDTSNAAEGITLGNVTTNPTINFTTNGYIGCDGIDTGPRLVLSEEFQQRPQSAGAVAATNASKTWELAGTGAVDASLVFASGGGISLVTTAVVGEQQIVMPHTAGADGSQSPWQGVQWSTNDSIKMRATIRVIDTLNTRIGVGFKILPATLDNGTDNDQFWVGYDAGGALGGVAANWNVIISRTNVDAQTDTGIVVANATVRFVLNVTAARVPQVYINGQLVSGVLAALTAGITTMKPFVGIQCIGGAATRQLNVSKIVCSKLLTN